MSSTFERGSEQADIEAEIERIFESPTIVNNFPGFLPYGFARKAILWAFERRSFIGQHLLTPSDEYLGKTFLEFLNDINVAIEKADIPLSEIERLQKYEIGGDPLYCELIQLTLPAYRLLREQGYSLHTLQG